jgi:ketosteroid isomerase-like protein
MSRYYSLLSSVLILLVLSSAAASQDTGDLRKFEREVRLADQAAAKAILERDEAGVDLYFAPNSITNNPRGGLTLGNEGVKALFKTGVINYASFERVIEHVEIHGKTAIVMGNETLTTAGKDGKPGEPVKRRFTNVWTKNSGRWQIIARHASIVCN